MEWLTRGGKQVPGVSGGPEATAENGKNGRDNDAADGSIPTETSKENLATEETDSIGEVGTQFPVKLEFKLPRYVKFFNCATVHKEWFVIVKRKDPTAWIITYKDAAITSKCQFSKTQK